MCVHYRHHTHTSYTHAAHTSQEVSKLTPSTGTSASLMSKKRFSMSTTASKPPPTEQVPIRKFKLQPDVARALTNRVEQQKLAMRQKQHHSASKTEYTPTVYQATSHNSNTVTKKRKVASVPSPRAYSGFSSLNTGSGTRSTVQWRPGLDKPPSVRGRSLSTTNKTKSTVPKAGQTEKVRKVRRMTSVDSGSSVTKPPGIITTSSWRSGKQLADKVLREKQSREVSPPPLPPPPHHSSTSSLFSSVDVSLSSLPQRTSGAAKEGEPLSTWTKESSKRKFEDILADLDHPSEDPQSEGRDTGLKGPHNATSRPKAPKKKPKVINGEQLVYTVYHIAQTFRGT